tara:strand:+ start:82 stop:456 length:375 start_codon:yes stop_codon:yes gene_type:complete
MPSEIANKIVDHIFSDEKAKAVDATNDAISATTYDAIQAKKLEFAKEWGFNPDQTGQSTADELENSMPDGSEKPELAPTATEVDQQDQQPEVEEPEEIPDPLPPNTAVVDSIEPIEEPKDETDS